MPNTGPRQRVARAAGGTAVEPRGARVIPMAIGVGVIGAAIAAIVLLGGGDEPAPASAGIEAMADGEPATPALPARGRTAAPAAPIETASTASAAPVDPSRPIRHLERALTRERLWGTVEVTGTRIDVRSGGCDDPGMGAVVGAAIAALREAGLTRLRCLEQSGRVVFERDL